MSGRLAMSPLAARAAARSAVRAASFAASLALPPRGVFSRPAIEGFFASVIHVPNHSITKPRATHQLRSRNQQLHVLFDIFPSSQLALRGTNSLTQPREVIRQLLVRNRIRHSLDDEIRRFGPLHVPKHHLSRENQRPRV